MLKELAVIEQEGLAAIAAAKNMTEVRKIRQEYLGKKGRLALLMRRLGELDPEQRPAVGGRANQLKQTIAQALADKQDALQATDFDRQLEQESVDITLPGERQARGTLHPLTCILREIRGIFISMGFEVVEGPDIETDFHNFTALNVPPNHPARDMQDTFYLPGELLLRTQTSPAQIRTMLSRKPPLAIIAPGACYRSDASDATHSPMFHQVEGLLVDAQVSFGDLKGVLQAFIHQLYGPEVPMRFRPSFFPFTEPSAEVDMGCVICNGSGCRVCSHTGWLEILGAGMVHPYVLENVGYNPRALSGFAFGVGLERLAMIKYQINDIRLLFENDLRFLRQF
jgi:phenylalanyl-tRNA synthetase alpha chain